MGKDLLTASRMAALLTCPRAHYWRYEVGMRRQVDGDALRFAVTHGRDLDVAIDPAAPTTLAFAFDGLPGARTAELESAAGSTLVFRYTVGAGDSGATGITVAAGTSIVVGGTTTIRDKAGRDASLNLPAATNPGTRVP
jgi:hypothetical protein